jgi:hypothetical protein
VEAKKSLEGSPYLGVGQLVAAIDTALRATDVDPAEPRVQQGIVTDGRFWRFVDLQRGTADGEFNVYVTPLYDVGDPIEYDHNFPEQANRVVEILFHLITQIVGEDPEPMTHIEEAMDVDG